MDTYSAHFPAIADDDGIHSHLLTHAGYAPLFWQDDGVTFYMLRAFDILQEVKARGGKVQKVRI